MLYIDLILYDANVIIARHRIRLFDTLINQI